MLYRQSRLQPCVLLLAFACLRLKLFKLQYDVLIVGALALSSASAGLLSGVTANIFPLSKATFHDRPAH